MSKVSLSTVERILSGKAKSTSFEILRDITFVLGGNMDDLARAVDSTPEAHPETYGAGPVLPTVPEKARELATAADLNALYDMFSGLLRDKDANYDHHIQALHARHAEAVGNLRSEHERELQNMKRVHERERDRMINQNLCKNVVIVGLIALVIVMLVLIVLYLLRFDVPNGDYGIFRY